MNQCPSPEDIDAWMDGENQTSGIDIGIHLESCSSCAARAAEIRKLNDLICTSQRKRMASSDIVTRLSKDQPVSRSYHQRVPRRYLVGGIAVAASVAALLSVPVLMRNQAQYLAPAVFGDFRTYLAADRSLDLVDDNAEYVSLWLSPNLPFELPAIPTNEILNLVGARLCWLMERRVAALSYVHQDRQFGLYVHQAQGLELDSNTPLPSIAAPPLVRTERGLAAAIWRRADLVVTLIGATDITTIQRFANELRMK